MESSNEAFLCLLAWKVSREVWWGARNLTFHRSISNFPFISAKAEWEPDLLFLMVEPELLPLPGRDKEEIPFSWWSHVIKLAKIEGFH